MTIAHVDIYMYIIYRHMNTQLANSDRWPVSVQFTLQL